MGEIVLEDKLLNNYANSTLHDFKPIIDNIRLSLNKAHNSGELKELAEKTISVYGGIYQSIQEKVKSTRLRNTNSETFFRLMAAYVSCEGTKQILKNGSDTELVLSVAQGFSQNSYFVDVSRTDQATLVDSFKIIGDSITYSYGNSNVKNSVISTLDKISQVTVDRIFSSANTITDYLNTTFKGKNFEVKPPTKQSTNKNLESIEKDQYTKGLQEYFFETVSNEDIIGCEEEKSFLDVISSCVMHYDSISKMNPFDNFPQFVILAGPPGTAKTMLANYFASSIKTKAKSKGIDVRISKFDNASIMQDGPVLSTQRQLNEISKGDRIELNIMDEMDKKMPSGNEVKDYLNQVAGAFLRFRGGSEYPNFHNYVMIGTTNSPEKIHKGILDVYKVIEMKGPKDTNERMNILELNLKKGIEMGYVNITDYGRDQIYKELDKHNFMGRSIKSIATAAQIKYLSIASKIEPGKSYEQVKTEIRNILSKPNSPYVTTHTDILTCIRQEAEKMKSVHAYV